jgi:hypothetical protein
VFPPAVRSEIDQLPGRQAERTLRESRQELHEEVRRKEPIGLAPIRMAVSLLNKIGPGERGLNSFC